MKRFLGLAAVSAVLLCAAPSTASAPRPIYSNHSEIEITNASDAGAWVTLIAYPSILGSAHKKNIDAYCVEPGKTNIWNHPADVEQFRIEATPRGCRGKVMLDQTYNTFLMGNHASVKYVRGAHGTLSGSNGRYTVTANRH